MKNKLVYLPLAIILAFCLFSFILDSGLVDPIIKKQVAYNRLFPQEKVFLHLDKNFYTAGEDIWFKAYLLDAGTHQPDTLSKTLYVDLIKPDQTTVIKRHMLEVKNGMAHGDFALPEQLPSGNYKIRAYTNWMRNFDHDFFFNQQISIYNYKLPNDFWTVESMIRSFESKDSIVVKLSLKDEDNDPIQSTAYSYTVKLNDNSFITDGVLAFNNKGESVINFTVDNDSPYEYVTVTLVNENDGREFVVAVKGEKPNIKFYPEGNDIIAGIPNAVAFKALDNAANPLEIAGEVLNEAGDIITKFKTAHQGMGVILLKPQKNEHYHVKVRYKNNYFEYPLPKVKNSGMSFSAINNYDENLNLRFYKHDPNDQLGENFALIAKMRGKVYWASQLSIKKDISLVTIPKSSFPTGVLHLTLFDSNSRPLQERLVFINHNDFLTIDLQIDKEKIEPRDEVSVSIRANDYQNKSVTANLSAAVVDLNQVDTSFTQNIISYLLLASDIKGKVHDPSYYFKDKSIERQQALDFLMMTHGWRRFKWEDILKQEYMVLEFLPEKGFSICGKALKAWNDKPASESQITFTIFGDDPDFIMLQAEEDGSFCFRDLDFTDTVSVLIQTANKRGNNRDMKLNLDSGKYPDIKPAYEKISMNATIENYIEQSRKREQIARAYGLSGMDRVLDEVVIEAEKEKAGDNQYKIYGQADASLNLEEIGIAGFTNVIDFLQGQVAGVQVMGSGANARIVVRGGGGGYFSGIDAPPLFLLDGMPVDQELIANLNINTIETIDVLKTPATTSVYGSRGANGVIAIYSKKGEYAVEKPMGILNMQYMGYYVPREFYSPDYDTDDDRHAMPDHRSVIHWEPVITTDSSGRASFRFHHSDLKTKVKVYVQGISQNGKPGVAEISYEVR